MKKVIKSSGEVESFNTKKLYRSLVRSGVKEKDAVKICDKVQSKITDETTSEQIYREAISTLISQNRHGMAPIAKYGLKRAVNSLGPTGFIFEKLLEALFQSYGFSTKRSEVMEGISGITHEIDILAKRKNIHALIEAKYKNQRGVKVQVDVVMYAWARLMDIEEYMQSRKQDYKKHQMWVITNNKFTGNAIKYAKHKKVILIGWNYPRKGGLEELIMHKNIYPITSLPSVNEEIRDKLTRKGIVIVRDLLSHTPEYLASEFSIPPNTAFNIVNEAHQLFNELGGTAIGALNTD